MIQAVLFDLDETLLDRSGSLRAFLHDQHARFLAHWSHVPLESYCERFLELDAHGYVHKSIVYAQLLEEYAIPSLTADELLADYRLTCSLHAQPFPGLQEMMAHLRSRGLKLGIVTNGETDFQQRHLDALELPAQVDAILISQKEGLRKPDPALFTLAAERLGVAPTACLFVGDHPQNDIHGAQGVGMSTVWFPNSVAWMDEYDRADYEIACLSDLLQLEILAKS